MLIELNNKMVEIDDDCVDLVLFFNEVGLKTKYSCQGHRENESFQIVFDESVTDDQIKDFLKVNLNKFGHSNAVGKFSKWYRYMSGELVSNWLFTCETVHFARVSYMRFIENKEKYNDIKSN